MEQCRILILELMIEVTCACIKNQNRWLICQRAESMDLPLKWEFPGGKREGHESMVDCLRREILEELNLDINILSPLVPVQHSYPAFTIKLHPYLCRLKSGKLVPREHRQVLWVSTSQLRDFDWAPADIPILKELENL